MATFMIARGLTCCLKPSNFQWAKPAFSTASARFGDNIDAALKIKEAPILDVKDALLNQQELAHKKSHELSITVSAKTDISSITGVPEEHVKGRLVRIYKPAKNAMQSGTDNIGHWQIDFDTRQRWENPCMGWASTGDPLSNLKVEFSTENDAIDFCEKNGWKWFVESEKPKAFKLRPYANNYAWNKRTRVTTK